MTEPRMFEAERLERLINDARDGEPDSRRLLHGRGRCYPGCEQINVDFFNPVAVVTLYAESAEAHLTGIMKELKCLQPSPLEALVVQRRYLAGAPAEWLVGVMPESWYARRGSLRFALTLDGQQNPGFFLDMEPGRRWLEALAPGKRVLNLFAYTCAFSVVAVAAGAERVVNVDMSKQALARGRDNHHINGLDKRRSEFLPEQILKSWSRIRRRGPYDVVILDPPSFQRGSFVATRDYAKLVRRLPELLPAGGDVLACLNAPELDTGFLQQVFAEHCPQARLLERLPGSEDFPDAEPERQLKLLHFTYPGVSG